MKPVPPVPPAQMAISLRAELDTCLWAWDAKLRPKQEIHTRVGAMLSIELVL